MPYDPKTDHYSLLGVADSATTEEIKRAYREKAKLVHPDGHRSPELATRATQMLTEAHGVLINAVKRRAYDEERAAYRLREYEPEIQRRVAAEVAKVKRTPSRAGASRGASTLQRAEQRMQKARERVRKVSERTKARTRTPLGLVPKNQQGTFMRIVEPKINRLLRDDRTLDAILLGVGAAMLDGWLSTPPRRR